LFLNTFRDLFCAVSTANREFKDKRTDEHYGIERTAASRSFHFGFTGLGAGRRWEAGVTTVLGILRKEFDLAMALSGCPSLSSITRDLCSQRICSVYLKSKPRH